MPDRKAHILVTDDEKAIRNTLKDFLEFEDYRVSTAESGREALEFVSKDAVDLVLLDIKMQGMDGIETLNQ
ncbi:MAG TPA: response regulator, partial [Gracilimonas sp.]|nr:response regulator [Gracilimonas sp.]